MTSENVTVSADESDAHADSHQSTSRLRKLLVFLSGLILLGLLHFALQHGHREEARSERGLTAFTVSRAIQHAVDESHSKGFYPPWNPDSAELFYDRGLTTPFYRPGCRYYGNLDAADGAVLVTTHVLENRIGYQLQSFPEPHTFFYLPYAVRNTTEGIALVDTCKRHAADGPDWNANLPAPAGSGSGGTDVFYRLTQSIQETLKESHPELPAGNFLRETFPVLIERPRDGGGWVAFVGRDPVWMEYPGSFPMTPEFIGALESLESFLQADTTP